MNKKMILEEHLMTGANMTNLMGRVRDKFPFCSATRSNPPVITLWLNFMLLPTERDVPARRLF